jgi:hypothetical protein
MPAALSAGVLLIALLLSCVFTADAAPTVVPSGLAVGDPFIVVQDATVTSELLPQRPATFLQLTFSVEDAVTGGNVDAVQLSAAKLYWCDPANANAQLSPAGVENQILMRINGYADASVFQVPTTLQLLDLNVTGLPSVVDGANAIAICGSLGFGAFNNTAAPVPSVIPSITLQVTQRAVVVSPSVISFAALVPSLAGDGPVSLTAGPAITTEFDDNTIWCRAAQTNTFASHQRLRAKLTQQVPAMVLRFFDPWGNPAVTLLADTVTVSFHVALPRTDLVTTARGVTTEVAAGASFVRVPATAITGAAGEKMSITDSSATLSVLMAAASTGQLLVRSEAVMQHVMQGGRTFRTCGELYLAPGSPQAIMVKPAPGEQATLETGPYNAQPVYMVAVTPKTLDRGVRLRVVALDTTGNAVAVPGGVLPPCTSFGQIGCVACGIPTSDTNVTLLRSVPAVVNDTSATTTWFAIWLNATQEALVDPSSTTAHVMLPIEVKCWIQAGFTGSSRIVGNHSTSEADALTSWTASTVRSAATLLLQPQGQYQCYDATTPLSDELPTSAVRELNRVFQNPVLNIIPFTTMRINLQSASGGPILRDPDLPRNQPTPPMDEHPLASWIVVPRSGFLDVPLGLMTVLAFGNTYSRTSAVVVNLTRPICDSTDYRQMERVISQWLYAVGDNSSDYYRQLAPTVDQANTVDIDLRVCYGAGLESLEFVTTECCDRFGTCSTSVTKSYIAYILLIGALAVAVAAAVTTCWYVSVAVKNCPVHLSSRYQITIADKTRIVMAHLLAPWIILAHMYFTFEVKNTPASIVWYADIAVCVLWPIGTLVRLIFPLYTFSKPMYYALGNVLLGYSTALMANAVIWILAALNLSVQLLPFCAALVLTTIQIFWAVLWAQDQLSPGMLSDEVPAHSIVPIDAALSVEYFAILATLFMFAIGQVEDLSAFYAVVAAVVFTLFFWVYNFSVGAQLTAALRKHLGEQTESQTAGGTAGGPAAQRHQMLQKVFSTARLGASRSQISNTGGGGGGGSNAGISGRQPSTFGDDAAGTFMSALSEHFTAPLLAREVHESEQDEEMEDWKAGTVSPIKSERAMSTFSATPSVGVPVGDEPKTPVFKAGQGRAAAGMRSGGIRGQPIGVRPWRPGHRPAPTDGLVEQRWCSGSVAAIDRPFGLFPRCRRRHHGDRHFTGAPDAAGTVSDSDRVGPTAKGADVVKRRGRKRRWSFTPY